MASKTYDDKMHLDMPFAEAMERFVGTNPAEMHANIAKSKKAKPPGGKKRPGGRLDDRQNVVQLRNRRKPHDV